jgi:F420-dependent oxidoreductase-like protein
MRVGMFLNYAGGFREVADEVAELERAGVDLVAVPEAYSFDAVSQLGFLAARTSTITLASGILQLYTRTPTLTAMTAAGLDYVSGGRFELGIGASGPQVIEGFHGVRYDAPLSRTREIVDICRMTWRREPVVHDGAKYRIPLPAGEGTGLGKPLKLINHPVRDRIPITIASLGPKSVEQTAEIADGWLPMFFHP